MGARTVIRIGDPFLTQKAQAITEFGTPELLALIDDMFATMAEYKGAGLAAPQIKVGLALVIFEVGHNPRYPKVEPVPRTILVNPQITPLSDEQENGWEGCLSVPGMRGLVPRYKHIRYSGFDPHGNRIERDASDFHARVVQHECDHLEGILYPQRIKNLSTEFGFIPELEAAGLIPKLADDAD